MKLEHDILKDIATGMYKDFYLVYIRKSTDEPDNQKNSITYQKAENVRFALKEKLPIAPLTLPGFCVDGIISEKHSGFKENNEVSFTKEGLVQYEIDRPKFLQLSQFLSKGYFKGIICLCWDRMSRNKADNTLLGKLMKNGVDVKFVYATYDTTSSGALHMDIDGMFAEHHSRVTSEKVRLATHNLRERGVVTHKAPVGYLNEGNMDHKPFDPIRAPIIKKLFEMYATGDWALSDLTVWANKQGLTSMPSKRKRTEAEMLAEDGEEVHIEAIARSMTLGHVHKILTNPFYTGRTFGNNGEYVKSISHSALIDDKTFNTVQEKLHSKNVSTRYADKLPLLHRGFARCADCGRVYTPYTRKGILYFGARCVKGCTNTKRNINLNFIETEMGKLISKLTFTKDELEKLDMAKTTDIVLFEQKRLTTIENNDREKKKIRDDLKYLRENKLPLLKSGVYSPVTYMEEETKLTTQITRLQDDEQISDLAMNAVISDVVKLSELLEYGSTYYEYANSDEKAEIIRIIFSELSLSQNTLQYKCRNGFKALESRFTSVCEPSLPEMEHLGKYGRKLETSVTEHKSEFSPYAVKPYFIGIKIKKLFTLHTL